MSRKGRAVITAYDNPKTPRATSTAMATGLRVDRMKDYHGCQKTSIRRGEGVSELFRLQEAFCTSSCRGTKAREHVRRRMPRSGRPTLLGVSIYLSAHC